MADRHARNPITYRPPGDTYGWLEDIAGREGRPVRAIVGDAVARARFISESDLAALDREVTRRTMELFTARTEGRDSSAEQAAADAAIDAYRYAIGRWQPPAPLGFPCRGTGAWAGRGEGRGRAGEGGPGLNGVCQDS